MVNVGKYIAHTDAMGYDTNPNNALFFRIIHPYICIKFDDSPPKKESHFEPRKKKKTALLSIEYWLFNRDPYHGFMK